MQFLYKYFAALLLYSLNEFLKNTWLVKDSNEEHTILYKYFSGLPAGMNYGIKVQSTRIFVEYSDQGAEH